MHTEEEKASRRLADDTRVLEAEEIQLYRHNCYCCCLNLGDLERYQEQISSKHSIFRSKRATLEVLTNRGFYDCTAKQDEKRGKSMSYSSAQKWYSEALDWEKTQGNPHNQLAIIAVLNKQEFVAVCTFS